MVAVDRSESMEIADPQRTPGEKLRLAVALRLGGDLPAALLRSWANDHDAGREPRWVGDDEARDDPARRSPLAASRRDAHAQVLESIDALTRTAAARRLLDGTGLDLLRKLTALHEVELVG